MLRDSSCKNLPLPLFFKEGGTGTDLTMVKNLVLMISLLLAGILYPPQSCAADRVRFAYPAKSLNYLPITIGRDKRMFQSEGIDLQMVLVGPTIQVTALTTGDIDFSGAQSQVMAGRRAVCL